MAKKYRVDLSQYPHDRIRNLSIIADIDHGKSTLANRLLELTGTIQRGDYKPQYLDKLQVERERGITVKAQTGSMFYTYRSQGIGISDLEETHNYLVNLIDTPGRVDFSNEVSRSLAAYQGVLLVVDAAQVYFTRMFSSEALTENQQGGDLKMELVHDAFRYRAPIFPNMRVPQFPMISTAASILKIVLASRESLRLNKSVQVKSIVVNYIPWKFSLRKGR
ncbi:hypothetical protein RJ639_035767 [Escallonia herrerae]|uniref:Tr-type G domain-containing protein n=1 Tax=Escallonia herrerae TaxID=1293975 RepID=A0AA89B8P2_9ASTE|nr:hypothetical protein RJ639_035767 [Escallonia herrerae]